MRLGQLARKLSISQGEVVEFLSKRNIQLEADSNARITDEDAALVIQHFNPLLLAEETEKQTALTEVEIVEPKTEVAVEEKIQMEEWSEQPIVENPAASAENEKEKIELIKAPKAELPGLKVLGKIELPEPKKKEDPKEGEPSADTEPATPIAPKKYQRQNQRKDFRDRKEERWKNPIEEKRARAAEEAERKRREQIKLEKELRTKHYNQKVKKTSQPTRAVKKVDEPLEHMSYVDPRPAPRTWIGKFWRWLSTP